MAKPVFKKLPTSVRLGRRTYKINLVKEPKGDPDEELYGLIRFDDCIEIRNTMSRRAIESTIIHEILHGLAHHFKFKLPEKKVRELERALYLFLRHNRWTIHVK